ncbi:MAG: tetratricopeptide repeat protein, partial [Planctomycetota bacterium]
MFAIAGETAWPYRLLGLLLHGALVLAGWRIAAKGLPPARAALAAAIFAVHPVHSEAVGDVANVGEMGAALLSFLLLSRVLGRAGAPSPGALALDGLLFLAALLAKESAAGTLPVVALAAFLPPAGDPRRKGRTLVLLPLLVALLADLALRTAALGFLHPRYLPTNQIENPLIFEPPGVRVPTAARVLVHGLGLLAFPWRLSADYSLETFRLSPGPLEPAALGSFALLLALPAAALLLRRSRPASSLFLLACLASFAPASNLLFPAGTIFAERHLLVPSLYFTIALLGLLPPGPSGPIPRSLAGVLLAAFAARAAARATEWRSDAGLTEVTSRRDSPRSVRLLYNLAGERWKAKDPRGAREALERALSIHPAFYQARTRLGLYRLDSGDEEGGVRDLREGLREALASFPGPSAHWSSAASTFTDALARRIGRAAEAVEYWRAFLAEFPGSPDARIELAHALDLAGLPGAEEELRAAARHRGGARILLSQRLPLDRRNEVALAALREAPPPGEGWDARAQVLFAEGQTLLSLARFGEAAAAFEGSLD